MRNWIVFSIFFINLSFGLSQGTNNSFPGDSNSSNSRERNNARPALDSLVLDSDDTLSNDIFSYSLDLLSEQTYANDTTLTDLEEYEMTRQVRDRYIHLGNPGSATTKLLWEQTYHDRFNLGFDQHAPYKIDEKDVRFYKIAKPYSKVYFSPGGSQSSFRAQALLARDFANNVSVSLRFNRINSEPIYNNSNVRHTNIHLGMYQRIDSSRWAYSINFISNSNFERINGGITVREDLDGPTFSVRSAIPVLLDDVYNYQLSRNYNTRLYYFIQDTIHSKQFLQLKINHDRGLYKFVNPGISTADTTVFGAERITSDLGMRRPINNYRSELRLSYHLEKKILQSQYWVRYAWNQLRTDVNTENISEIVAGTSNQFLWKGLSLNLDGYTGLIGGKALLDLNPKAGYNYKDKAGINFGLRIHTEPSAYQINNLEITFVGVKDEEAFVLSSQEIFGEIDIPFIGLRAKLSSYAGQNIPVLDTSGMQINQENIEYLQLDVEEKLAYRWIHFDNRFVGQLRSAEVYDMPSFYTRSAFYVDGLLFDALQFQTGINFDFVPKYSLPSYNPLYGLFYKSNTESEGPFYRIDLYASIKVQSFRFFAKYEHMNDLWQPGVYYEVRNYPQLDARFRMGVSWELRN